METPLRLGARVVWLPTLTSVQDVRRGGAARLEGSRGVDQAHEGDVDVAAVVARLRDLDYQGTLSVDYFDLPEWG